MNKGRKMVERRPRQATTRKQVGTARGKVKMNSMKKTVRRGNNLT